MPERVELLAPRHAAQVAAIDVVARAGDFLPSLGVEFLTSLYTGMLDGEGSWGHGVVSQSGEVLGFIVGCLDTKAVFRRLSPVRDPRMFRATLGALARRPSSLLRTPPRSSAG